MPLHRVEPTPPAPPGSSAPRRLALLSLATALLAAALPALAVTPEQAVGELQRTLDAPMRRQGQAAPGLLAQMQAASVPGVAIAVIHQGRLHWTQGFGDASAGVPVTPSTRFQAASISKPVTALAALQLADELRVDWDADLRPQLGGWTPTGDDGAPRYSLRRLLTHTAGLGVSGFPGYASGQAVPTLRQVLQGQPPANTAAVQPVQAPGSFRYSGGGTSIVQWWMQQRSEPDFAAVMDKRLLRPLGMAESHFEQPPRDGAPAARYARGHVQGRPIPGGHHTYPEQAAAGLWTTASDLARLLLAVQAARRGEPGPIAPALARAMTTPGAVPHMGIGFFLSGEPGRLLRFGHEGLNAGFASAMFATLDGGEGLVVLTNAQGEAAPVIEGVLRTLARVYDWPGGLQAPLLAASQDLPRAAADWAGDYPGFGPAGAPAIRIRHVDDTLWWARGPADWVRLWRLADDGGSPVFTTNGQHRFQFDGPQLRLDGRPLTRQPAAPLSWPPLFVRGSFNAWRTDAPLQAAGDGRWQGELSLPAGRHAFKLADAQWREVDLGSDQDDPVQPDRWQALRGRGGNLRIELPAAGRWQLELELRDSPQPARLRLKPLP